MFIGRFAGISTTPGTGFNAKATGVWDLNIFGFFRNQNKWPKRGVPTSETTTYTTVGSVLSATWPGPSGAAANPENRLYVRFWVQGAGGGNGNSTPLPVGDYNGGTGGFVDYTHTSNLQTTYKLVVGQAGQPSSGGTAWGGGGDGGAMPGRSQFGGGGGGGSFVFYEPVTSFSAPSPYHGSIIVCAGGGGGTFFSGAHTGGKGGTSTGQPGQTSRPSGNGGGGSQSSVGSSGPDYPGGFAGTNASNHQGGSSAQSGYEYGGGGGGGGYYGGGAGGSCINVCPGPTGNGAGGGGSSYYRSSEGTLNAWSQGTSPSNPNNDASYGNTGEPGKITIEWGYLS